jgi:hypothetical protein
LYEPIFVTNGAGQQVVNRNNYLAGYVYDVISTYGNSVKFWEVWNEPDFSDNYDASQNTASATYWGTVNPLPCDLSRTSAPISHHVRLHRVVYEVIKSVNPHALVATGGIGYVGYLEALLRNTDNPGPYPQKAGENDGTVEGAVSTRYPRTGGAYFDVLSYHSYPQYSLSRYAGQASNCASTETFIDLGNGNTRCSFAHSDRAVQSVFSLRDDMQAALASHGYDGTLHPAKNFIITENNIPRELPEYVSNGALDPRTNQWGSDDYAHDYVMKVLIEAQRQNIGQFYLYSISDEVRPDGTDCAGNLVGTDNTKVEGLFEDLSCVQPQSAVRTVQADAFQTTSNMLYRSRYSAAKTQQLALPSAVDGAVFESAAGTDTIVLWAKTTQDRSEAASATYSLPAGTYSQTDWQGTSTSVSGSNLALSGSPLFFVKQ